MWLGASSHLCNLSKPIKTLSKPHFFQEWCSRFAGKGCCSVARCILALVQPIKTLSKPYFSQNGAHIAGEGYCSVAWCIVALVQPIKTLSKASQNLSFPQNGAADLLVLPPQRAQQQVGGTKRSPPASAATRKVPPKRAQQHTSTIIAERNVAPSHIAIPISGTSLAPPHPGNLLKPYLIPI